MEEERDIWQRFGGHLLLLAVALTVVFSRQIQWAGNPDDGAEPALAAPAPAVTVSALTEPTPLTAATVLPPGDLSVASQPVVLAPLPVVSDTSFAPAPNPHTYG